jgi:predicted RNase H-like nuclease (RuvC/YqgF family)
MSMFDMYRQKKKREVDPNAPPRPNLLSHDKVIRDQKLTIEQLTQNVHNLSRKVEEMERKLINQTAYLNALHQTVSRKK